MSFSRALSPREQKFFISNTLLIISNEDVLVSDGSKVLCLDSPGDVLALQQETDQCVRGWLHIFLYDQQESHLNFGEQAADTLGVGEASG